VGIVRIPCLLLFLLIALTGCGSQTAAGPAAGAATGDPLSFSGETIDGEAFEGASLAGRPAVLWFWAPWCPTCRGQVPAVTAAAQEYGDEVAFVGVGSLDDDEAIEGFAADAEAAGLTQLSDPDGEVWRHFGITEQSVYVVLDADGEIVSDGYLDNDELADVVAGLVP